MAGKPRFRETHKKQPTVGLQRSFFLGGWDVWYGEASFIRIQCKFIAIYNSFQVVLYGSIDTAHLVGTGDY